MLCLYLILTGCQREEQTGTNIINFEYVDLEGVEFWFGSGAGAWRTVVEIQADGAFYGNYIDSNAGEMSAVYPRGTKRESNFSGRFSPLVKTGDYEYAMTLESFSMEGILGGEEVIDGVRIITTEPHGFDNAYDFYLYLPGKKRDDLPEGFLNWSHGFANGGLLTSYGLYNVGGQQGFIVWSSSQ
jgi:hypothetical protein